MDKNAKFLIQRLVVLLGFMLIISIFFGAKTFELKDKNQELREIIARHANYIYEIKVDDQRLLIISNPFNFSKYPEFANDFRQFYPLKDADVETRNLVIFRIANTEYDEYKNPIYKVKTTEDDLISARDGGKVFALLKVPKELLKE